MIFCPYCKSQNEDEFYYDGGHLAQDNPNEKWLETATHNKPPGGCGRRFFVVREMKPGAKIVGCFKGPSDWDQPSPFG